MVRLALHYGGHDRDLLRGQALSLGLGEILIGPKGIVSGLLLVQDVLHRCRPIDLIGVRNDQGEHIGRCETVTGKQQRIVQRIGDLGGVQHHLVGDFAGDPALLSHSAGKDQIHGRLPAVLQHPDHIDARLVFLHDIMPRFQVAVRQLFSNDPGQIVTVDDYAVGNLRKHIIHSHLRTDIQISLASEVRFTIAGVPTATDRTQDHDHQQRGDQNYQFPSLHHFFIFLPRRMIVSPSRGS